MNTEAIKSCPKCQAPIPEEAPQGLCPKCLLAAASLGTEAGEGGKPAEASGLPSLETIAAGFPQLEILEFIGQGGMGLVFKARQPKLDRFVALKLLPQKPGADPAFCERFNREARVLARLSHPNIVAVHDFGEAGPFFYLLMEFVDGVNLRQAMQAGRFTPAQALAIVPKVCDALQYAHEEGVLHRDIKPENLLLDKRGRVKIADFGIAKLMGDPKDITLTAKGAAIGTPHYMAPEQFERPHDVDQRADVYSLGVVFYEMLTGELPIGRFAPPSEKAAMDPRVDEVVLRSLEKERERRFQSAGDVKTRVEQITATPNPAGSSGTPNQAASAHPHSAPVQNSFGPTVATTRSSWSGRAITAAALVGSSLLVLVLAIAAGIHIGPNETALLSLLIGLPACSGTFLAWTALRTSRQETAPSRGGRLALLSAVAWPLLILNLLFLFTLFLCTESLEWHLLGGHRRGLMGVVGVIGALAIVGTDAVLLRHWLKLWSSEGTPPQAELCAILRRLPRRAVWLSGGGLALLSLALLVSHRHIDRIGEQAQVSFVQEPNAPPGYEVAPGGSPGNDGRIYRSAISVPPGYALTITAVLCSNQVVLRPDPQTSAAALLAPEGQPLQGELTWRLLGDTTFADGAPLRVSLGLLGNEASDKSFHIFPPEPVSVDWVSEPARLWPPQTGHTKFLLVKGTSSNPAGELPVATEWVVGIEERLDPIPTDSLLKLQNPVVVLGTNWPSVLEIGSVDSTNRQALTLADVGSQAHLEQLQEYLKICTLLEQLTKKEQDLLVTFTPESAFVKQVREQITANRKRREQLERENPDFGLLHAVQTQDPASKK
jgi:tRNA A-37 threonylcarbamoyl transferase component Bud32